MYNIIDYVINQKETFGENQFTNVDGLVLSQIAYFNFDGIIDGVSQNFQVHELKSLKEVINTYGIEKLLPKSALQRENNKKLLDALSKSDRFGDLRLAFYENIIDNQREEQFSAITFLIDDGNAYIAYRGTDSTFVGWKEDFNMSFMNTVPAQDTGRNYLDKVSKMINSKIRVGGHSKGGNLAVYASVMIDDNVKEKIIEIYNYDGPGFKKQFFESENYNNIKEKIYTILPQSSVVGMLFYNQDNYHVVDSDRLWVMQHDPYSWMIENDSFVYLERVDNSSIFLNKVVNSWLESIDETKRELFVDTLYYVLDSSGCETFNDLSEHKGFEAIYTLHAIRNLDEETKKFIIQTIISFVVYSLYHIPILKRKK